MPLALYLKALAAIKSGVNHWGILQVSALHRSAVWAAVAAQPASEGDSPHAMVRAGALCQGALPSQTGKGGARFGAYQEIRGSAWGAPRARVGQQPGSTCPQGFYLPNAQCPMPNAACDPVPASLLDPGTSPGSLVFVVHQVPEVCTAVK